MWLLNVNIFSLLILINLTSALNKNDSLTQLINLPIQSLTSHVLMTQNSLKNQDSNNQQLSDDQQFSSISKEFNQFNQQIQFNQLNKFSPQISNNQQQTTKEISCNANQTINFVKYSNRKLSLNFLNKLTEFTVTKLLNQSSTLFEINSKLLEKLHNSLNYSKPITHLCYEACRNDLECLAFAINSKQFTCYLIKEDYTTNKDYLLFDTSNSWSFYEKVCFNQVQTTETCNQIWTFDIHLNGHLNNPSNSKQRQLTTTSLEECLNECRTNLNGTLNFKCRSINFDSRNFQCTLNQHNRRLIPEAYITENQFTSMDNQVYADNHCLPFQGKCVFRHLPAYYLPDYQVYNVETNVNSVESCEQLCVNQSQYICRAFSYSKQMSLCKLSPEQSSSLINTINNSPNRMTNARRLEVLKSEKITQQVQQQLTQNQQNSFLYYERTSCINVTIECNGDSMHTKIDCDGPFTGRLFTANNFEKCSKSNLDPSLEQIKITIPLDSSECGTVASGNGTFSNRLILQYHPLILKESDRRIEISCDYHLVKQKVRGSKRRVLEGLSGSHSVITGLAESPPVKCNKILNEEKEEVRGAKLGDTLFFKVEISDESVFGIFGSSLVAKSGNGNESLLLIDDHGCPLEPSIFPAVNVKSPDSKSLTVPFQAFKFATDSSIKFQMTISFCLDSCAVITCDGLDLAKKRSLDLAANNSRKRRATDKEYKAGDIVSDVKMETNFFIISDDENNMNSDATLVADVKQSQTNPSLIGTSLLVTKAKTGQRHSQIVGNGKLESYNPHSEFNSNDRVCFSPVLVYLFALLALVAQFLLMFFCIWVLFNRLKRKSYYHQTRVNSRTSSSQLTDAQSIYSLRTGSSTLKNYYTNKSSLVDNLVGDSLNCIGGLNGSINSTLVNNRLMSNGLVNNGLANSGLNSLTNLNNDDLNKQLKWSKEGHLWPIKLNKSCSSSSNLYSSSNLVSIFNNKHSDDYFNKDHCLT